MFTRRELPVPAAVAFLVRSFARATYRHSARLVVGLPADAVRAGVFATSPATSTRTPRTPAGSRSPRSPAELVVQFVAAIASLGAPVSVEETSDEVGRRVGELAAVLGAIVRRRRGEPRMTT